MKAMVLGAALAVLTAGGASAAQPVCGHACLEGFADKYMSALAARDPRAAPFAKGVKFTENSIAMEIGDGLWGTATGVGGTTLKVSDPSAGMVGLFGTVAEKDVQSFYAMRMKVEGGRITEVETLVNRKRDFGVGPYGDPAALAFDPLYKEPVPAKERLSREKLIALADGYFSTLQQNDGTIRTAFDDGCLRQENGTLTAGHPDPKSGRAYLKCRQQFETGAYRWDDRVRDRRYFLIDPDHGLVMASMYIDHSGKIVDYKLANGAPATSPFKAPHNSHVLELFKVKNGKLTRIEAVFINVPYRTPSPWVLDGAATRNPLTGYGRP
jgi:hypothetical protein